MCNHNPDTTWDHASQYLEEIEDCTPAEASAAIYEVLDWLNAKGLLTESGQSWLTDRSKDRMRRVGLFRSDVNSAAEAFLDANYETWHGRHGAFIPFVPDSELAARDALDDMWDEFTGIGNRQDRRLLGPLVSPETQWAAMDDLRGWNVCRDNAYHDAVKRAHLERHPDHWSYQSVSHTGPLSKHENKFYDKLNNRLHDRLNGVAQAFFVNVPVPAELPNSTMSAFFTPFTYQNYDWYSPSYECYIVVLTRYICAELLYRFQSLLCADHEDWCIMVVASDTIEFDDDHQIAVFCDRVFMPESAASALNLPARHR